MNKPLIILATLLASTSISASTIDRNIFLSCIYDGYLPSQCAAAVADYHREITPNGTTIFRGNKNWYYQNETTLDDTTIFRGR